MSLSDLDTISLAESRNSDETLSTDDEVVLHLASEASLSTNNARRGPDPATALKAFEDGFLNWPVPRSIAPIPDFSSEVRASFHPRPLLPGVVPRKYWDKPIIGQWATVTSPCAPIASPIIIDTEPVSPDRTNEPDEEDPLGGPCAPERRLYNAGIKRLARFDMIQGRIKKKYQDRDYRDLRGDHDDLVDQLFAAEERYRTLDNMGWKEFQRREMRRRENDPRSPRGPARKPRAAKGAAATRRSKRLAGQEA